jgi:hypothetical protein
VSTSPVVGGNRADVGGVSVGTDHYIGGRRVASATTFEDRSPLDWSVTLADVARGDAHTADLAVSAAVDAFPEWAAMGVKGRGEVMRRVADLIDAHVPSLATVECLDMAMLEESLRLRVLSRGARNFRAYADLAEQYDERVWASNGTANRVMRMPAGPTVVITHHAPSLQSIHPRFADSLLNASMILTGMGPVTPLTTVSGKLFAVAYCLFSGIVFLSLMAIILAPIYHRFLHSFHLAGDDEVGEV